MPKNVKLTIFTKQWLHQLLCIHDNVVVDTIKLILLNYSNISIAKIVVKEIERVKLTLSRLPMTTELLFNILVLIKSIQKS